MTLNNAERRNGHYLRYFPNLVALVANNWPSTDFVTPTKHDGRAVLFTIAEILVTVFLGKWVNKSVLRLI